MVSSVLVGGIGFRSMSLLLVAGMIVLRLPAFSFLVYAPCLHVHSWILSAVLNRSVIESQLYNKKNISLSSQTVHNLDRY